MATAVQGKVPAHKAPVNHEESDDDVDDDDVRSLPPLLLFRQKQKTLMARLLCLLEITLKVTQIK